MFVLFKYYPVKVPPKYLMRSNTQIQHVYMFPNFRVHLDKQKMI